MEEQKYASFKEPCYRKKKAQIIGGKGCDVAKLSTAISMQRSNRFGCSVFFKSKESVSGRTSGEIDN